MAQKPDVVDKPDVSQLFESKDPSEKRSDEIQYPKAWRVVIITIGLCLSILCAALVRSLEITAEC